MPRVVFTPSGLDGVVPTAPRCCRLPATWVSTSTQCAAAAASAAAARWPRRGPTSQVGIDSAAEALSPWNDTEQAYADRRGMKPDRRLGCCAVIGDDVVLDVPPESQVHRPVVRKSLDLTDVVLDPAVHLCYLELPPSAPGRCPVDERPRLRRTARRARPSPSPGSICRPLHEVHAAFAGQGRPPRWPSATPRSSPSGPASSTVRSASRSTSAAPPSPATCAISAPARCSPRPGG